MQGEVEQVREKPLTLPEVAEATGYPYRQIRMWVNRGFDPLPSVPVGRSLKQRRVYMSDFEKWELREKARARRAVR